MDEQERKRLQEQALST